MQKKQVMILAILAIMLSACGQTQSNGQSFVPTQKEESSKKVANTEIESEVAQSLGKLKSSLRDLMTRGVAAKCSMKMDDGGASQVSTLYIDGRRMRVDGVMSSDGKQFDSHMISDGEYSYSWSEAMPTAAMKMRIPDTEKKATTEGETESVDFDKPLDMDCQAWVADGGLFEVPSGINFNDVTEMMEHAVGSQSDPCRSCDLVPAGPDQIECQKNLCQD